MCHCILIAAATQTDYGPFAPVVGYVIALASTVGAFALTWRGRLAKWKPPEEVLPSAAQKFVVLLSMVFVGLAFYYSRPETVEKLFWAGGIIGSIAFVSFVIYTFVIFAHRYPNTRVKNPKTDEHEFRDILGGFWLTASARKTMREGVVTPDGKRIQPPPTITALLNGVDGDLESVWSKNSRGLVMAVVTVLFVATLFFGNLAVGCTGFGIQVHLTKKSAEKTTRTEDAPGLNKGDANQK